MCLSCEKLGVKPPAAILQVESAKADRATGVGIAIGAIGLAILVVLAPARDGASPGGKLRLLGYAVSILGIGLAMVSAANRRLHKKKK